MLDWHSVLSQFQVADDDNRDEPNRNDMVDLHSVLSQLQGLLLNSKTQLTFAVSFANLSLLHKPLEEQKEKALKGLRKRMKIARALLWIATVVFFIAFVLGFWIVYPDENPVDPVMLRANIWPRWFTLGLAVVKVAPTMAIVYNRRVEAYLFL
ncbi:unnamed protein product [Arabis nemorensis]|uniref:Uncharacterized protein n=1 Tax=Arabis nemorensis TaxID=586526 RepID=A0A565AQC3_9BRAS|nr:unnamed protein product [Arabis nemorensis]